MNSNCSQRLSTIDQLYTLRREAIPIGRVMIARVYAIVDSPTQLPQAVIRHDAPEQDLPFGSCMTKRDPTNG